jgi:hypothetical protein
MSTELYIPPVSNHKRDPRPGINWTPEMIDSLVRLFPVTFNRVLAKQLGIGWRSLVRKARDLGIEKEPDFLEKRRKEITDLAVKANHNPNTGKRGWSVPNSEFTRFKPGNISVMKVNPDVVEKVRVKRNKTIKRERLRLKYGMPPLTKLKLKFA